VLGGRGREDEDPFCVERSEALTESVHWCLSWAELELPRAGLRQCLSELSACWSPSRDTLYRSLSFSFSLLSTFSACSRSCLALSRAFAALLAEDTGAIGSYEAGGLTRDGPGSGDGAGRCSRSWGSIGGCSCGYGNDDLSFSREVYGSRREEGEWMGILGNEDDVPTGVSCRRSCNLLFFRL